MEIYLRSILFRILAIFLLVILVGCSKSKDDSDLVANDTQKQGVQKNILQSNQNQNSLTKKHKTTIRATFVKNSNNRTSGDFTNVKFSVENYSQNTILTDKIDCTYTDNEISCEAVTDLNDLKPAIYRLVIKSGDGLLGSDVFEIMPNLIPVVITIDNESTGYYILQLINQMTGFDEKEVTKRVRDVLSISPTQEYDLEITLYDLFMHFGGSQDMKKTINLLSEKLQKDQPETIEGQDGISGSLKPIY